MPLYALMSGSGKAITEGDSKHYEGFVEGIVFMHPKTGQMAKLRRDMFSWYIGKHHKEENYEKNI